MAEYIERDALIAEYDRVHVGAPGGARKLMEDAPAADVVPRGAYEQVAWERDEAMEQLEKHNIPFGCIAADVVEVVRCRECKLWIKETSWCCRHSHFIGAKGEACHPWESNDWKTFDENDFCSYGERKDGAENETD